MYFTDKHQTERRWWYHEAGTAGKGGQRARFSLFLEPVLDVTPSVGRIFVV